MVIIFATITPVLLRNLSLRRLQRLTRRKDLFDELAEPGAAVPTPDQTRQAQEQIKIFHKGLKRVSLFAFTLLFILACSIPYFSALPAAFVSFFLGALTLVIGTAAKPAIENFISGVVLAFSRTVNIGDTVLIDEKHYGTVEDLGYTHCVVKIWDWRRYVVPNREMLTKTFVNYSLHDTYQLAYIELRVAPETDMDLLKELCETIPKQSEYYSNWEEPALWVMEMDKDSILGWCGAWADSPSDAWMLRSDMRNGLIRAFQEHGITTHSLRVIHNPPADHPFHPREKMQPA